MPQIEQLPTIFWSQLFWLAVVFGILFFVIGRNMLPKIEATVDQREAKVAEDLAAADAARRDSDTTEEAYRTRMNESRAAALKVLAEAKQASARATEARVAEADAATRDKVEAAEARLRASTESALADLENVAAEAAQEMVAKLAGVSVSRDDAEQAVKAELVRG